MNATNVYVLITTENPEQLSTFYGEVVGLPSAAETAGPHAFMAGSTIIGFDTHSDTKGAVKEPSRVLLDFFVDDLAAEQKRIEGHGVTFLRTAGREEWGGIISTFADPDGNLLQLIEYNPA